MHFSIWGLLKILRLVWSDISVFLFYFLFQLWTNNIYFFFLVSAIPVLLSSCNFLFSTFVAVCRIASGCVAMFFLFTARPPLRVVWPVSKNNGEAVWHFTSSSAPSQQESCQGHSHSDCKPHQTAHMLKVRHRKPPSSHFCWDWPDIRDNWLYSHHGHFKCWRWETRSQDV